MDVYHIKIGNMYIYEICTSEHSINNNFIEDLELTSEKNRALRIYENEKNKIGKILKEILYLEDEHNVIFFEKIESEEK